MTDRVVVFRGGALPTAGVSPGDFAAEVAARVDEDASLLNLASAGDQVRLSYVSGDGQDAVYEVVAAQATLTLGAGQLIQFAWPGGNTGAGPTLTIGAAAYTLLSADGGALAAADLRAGSYVGRIHSGTVIRVLNLTRVADVPGLGAALAANAAATVAAQATADDAVQDAAEALNEAMDVGVAVAAEVTRATGVEAGQQAQIDAAALERQIMRAVQQVLASAGVFPLGKNNLGIVHGVTDNKNRLLGGQRPSGTAYEGPVVREVLGANNLDLLYGTTDANGRLLHGIRRSGGFFAAGLANDPLYDNNLDLVGNVVVDADDRVIFGLRSDGSLLAYVATVNTRWEMFPLTGQSLAEGGANAAITTASPYDAEVAAKFSNGPVGKQTEVIGPSLVPLAEQVNETISTGMARRVLADHPDIRFLMAGQAWGGKTIAEISLGAADGIYEKILAQMDVAAALAPGAVIRAVGMINGEADGIISTPDFDLALETYRRQFASDVAGRLGQIEVPFLMTCQTSSVAGYRGGSIALRDSFLTPFAQLRAALSNPYIVLVGPKYHLVYVDHAHIDALSTRLWGEKYGQVWRHLFLNNRPWLPVHAQSVARDNDAIVLDLHSPVGMPVEVDIISVTDPGDLGFNLLDAGSITIGSVTQTGDFQITVECSGNVPDGSRLSYAFHNGIAGTSGWNTGARGCIRDSDATRSIYTGAAMPNWLCAFQTNF